MKSKEVHQQTLELLNKKNLDGKSPIYLAIINGQVKKVESLLQWGVDTNNIYENFSALAIAFRTMINNKNRLNEKSRQNMLLIVGHLLEANAVVNDWTLCQAIEALHNTEEIDLLFKLIKKCQSFDETQITYDCTSNKGQFIHWLVEYDCDHRVFEAVLERVNELSQLKSEKAAVEKLPTFFSPAQRAAAFRNTMPDEFICPITKEKMKKPVMLEDGYSYEEEAIREHLSNKKTSPMTNLELKNPNYYENHFLKKRIDAHQSINKPSIQRSQSLPELKISYS